MTPYDGTQHESYMTHAQNFQSEQFCQEFFRGMRDEDALDRIVRPIGRLLRRTASGIRSLSNRATNQKMSPSTQVPAKQEHSPLLEGG